MNHRFSAHPGLGDWEVWDAQRGEVRWSGCTESEAKLIEFALNAATDGKRLYAICWAKSVAMRKWFWRWESAFNHRRPMPRWAALCRAVEWLGLDCMKSTWKY